MRRHDLAGRPDRGGDDDRAAGRVRDLARQRHAGGVDLAHPALGAVQLQPAGIAAERVGQEDVAARLDRAAVEAADVVRLVEVPELGRLARGEAHVEEVGAGGAIGHQPVAVG